MPQPFLFNLIDKAVFDYKLIQNADRILVGASGGKDSTALIEYFANRKKDLDLILSLPRLMCVRNSEEPFPKILLLSLLNGMFRW